MCSTLVHRGPDDSGILLDGAVGMGMRRLSIIDVAGGRQPIYNEDGTVAVVYNGEIYNFRALRSTLEAHGHRFRTESDTEVIVHLWEEHGIDFACRLDGMFAIALFDRMRRRVVLARDQVGIKPLYYHLSPSGIVFGSEVKALLASGRVPRRLDVDALGQFVSWEYVPGAATLLDGVRRLEPGCTLELDLDTGTSEIRRYWHPAAAMSSKPDTGARTDQDWEDRVDEAVQRAVRQQLISDVPLGAFLSGGVDSSLVVSAMGPARTFTIGFDDRSYDELRWARRVADHLSVGSIVETLRTDASGLFDDLMHYMDDPIGDFSIFPTYLVSRLARRHVKVALSGDGGDELFGGYETYLAELNARTWQRLPGWIRSGVLPATLARIRPTEAKKGLVNKAKRFVEGAEFDPALGHARWRLFCDEALRAALFTDAAKAALRTPVGAHIAALRSAVAEADERDSASYVDFASYLVDNCLAKVDRMSMACSLEVRVPLLSRELVELAFAMPPHLKYDRRRTKILLKRVAARHVPEECVYRPKEGFSMPVKRWLRDELRVQVDHFLAPDRLGSAGLLEPATVARLLAEHRSGSSNHSHVLWTLLVFEQWRDRWGVTV
jgi:asparagine synthase (glutamine-hydrolysing)